MQRHTALFLGITLITVPTIAYGGLTILGILTQGVAGAPGPTGLTELQVALYRAGHAHAGVLLVLSLVLQIALEHARMAEGARLAARIAAPLAAILVSGGFFALAHAPVGRLVLYAGVVSFALAVLAAGIGLLRAGAARRAVDPPADPSVVSRAR